MKLPTTIKIKIETLNYEMGTDFSITDLQKMNERELNEIFGDFISDYISDEYEFCHEGWEYCSVGEDSLIIENIHWVTQIYQGALWYELY